MSKTEAYLLLSWLFLIYFPSSPRESCFFVACYDYIAWQWETGASENNKQQTINKNKGQFSAKDKFSIGFSCDVFPGPSKQKSWTAPMVTPHRIGKTKVKKRLRFGTGLLKKKTAKLFKEWLTLKKIKLHSAIRLVQLLRFFRA
jgi:hypothetical protein